MGRDGIGQISRGRTGHSIEAELLCLGQRYGDHTILETQRGQADGIILNV